MAKAARAARAAGKAGAAGSDDAGARRDAIVDAALTLVAERGWRRTVLADVAAAARLSLAEVYACFPDKSAILAAFGARIDKTVLSATDEDIGTEEKRDRLFDLLMRRFDALAPHRTAVRALLTDARRDPFLLLAGAPRLLRSMAWTLEAAGIGSCGLSGILRTKALAALYLSVLSVWVEDDTPDMARTMAALDGRLRRAQRLLGA